MRQAYGRIWKASTIGRLVGLRGHAAGGEGREIIGAMIMEGVPRLMESLDPGVENKGRGGPLDGETVPRHMDLDKTDRAGEWQTVMCARDNFGSRCDGTRVA